MDSQAEHALAMDDKPKAGPTASQRLSALQREVRTSVHSYCAPVVAVLHDISRSAKAAAPAVPARRPAAADRRREPA